MKIIFRNTKHTNLKYYKCWEKMGFNYNKEYSIYNFLCKHKKYKYGKKLEYNMRFNTYSEWEEYIRLKYKNSKVEDVKNLYKYLNLMKRTVESKVISENNVLLPAFIAFFTSIYTNKLQEIMVDKAGIVLAIVVLVGTAILFLAILPLLSSLQSRQEIFFYNDYMEVLDIIIDSKAK